MLEMLRWLSDMKKKVGQDARNKCVRRMGSCCGRSSWHFWIGLIGRGKPVLQAESLGCQGSGVRDVQLWMWLLCARNTRQTGQTPA